MDAGRRRADGCVEWDLRFLLHGLQSTRYTRKPSQFFETYAGQLHDVTVMLSKQWLCLSSPVVSLSSVYHAVICRHTPKRRLRLSLVQRCVHVRDEGDMHQ